MDEKRPMKESKTCPTCSRAFLAEADEKQCEVCRRDGKHLLNE